MKIGILTHPLKSNYGGILQCYALNKYLNKLGHETIVIQRFYNRDLFLKRWIRASLKAVHHPRYYKPDQIDKTAKIRLFVDKQFKQTKVIDTPSKILRVCNDYHLDAVIVGSDQVWRTDYAMKFGYNYFLDFVSGNVIKASYAASFGLSDWHYTEEQTNRIKSLLSRFKAISVREDEGVTLIKDNIGIDAEHLVDPTLLLTPEDYKPIVAERQENEHYVFVYWLGDKSVILSTIEEYKQKGIKVIDINLRDNKEQPSIERWLSYIKYADTVITDSFHGCVFSIIFNVPFIIHSNDSGGNRRLLSLFNQLGIIEKITNPKANIEYDMVNTIITKLQRNSYSYLIKVLS